MDKLEVSPRSVRGYGNIIIPKLSTDFVGKYNEIYTDEDGYFVLSYGGVMLKASATVSNTIKGIQASLTVLVSTRDSDTPVSGLSVDCSVDDTALTSQTTDSTGKCTFTWTPSDLGDSSLMITVTPQDDYAGLSLDKTVTVGLLLGFDGIMTSLSLEDDEVYSGTFEEDVEDRSQLSEFVKDVWVASGGEPIVDEYGIIHICDEGDLVVESEGLEQLPEYSNVLFEEDVDLLTGAVYDMSITEDYEIVLDCLERDDIVPAVNVVLTASSTSVDIGDSVTFTATCTFGEEPITEETVSFYDGNTLLGSDETDSDGVATYTASSLSAGSHTVSAVCEDKNSNNVSVTVNKLTPSISLSVPATGTVGTAYTVSGTLLPSTGTVSLYENSWFIGTLTVSDGVFSKSFTKETSGTYKYIVRFTGNSDYEAISSNYATIVVSDEPPVPSYDGVSLTSDKSILSYADSESATLSAQLTDNGSPVSIDGVTVEFFKGSTSLGTADTNSSGVATKTYASAGSGDISVSAEVDDITSNSVSIEDCIRYDGATSDKTSNYSTTNLNSLTFSTDHYEAYRSLGTSPSSTYYSPIYVDDTLPSNFEMSVMYKASTNMNKEQTEFIISSTHPTTYSGATELGIVVSDSRRGLFHRVSGSATWYTESSTLSNNTWYTFYLKVEGTTVTAKILDSSDNTVYTSTQTISAVQNYKKWSIINGGNSRTLHWKELKIKTL